MWLLLDGLFAIIAAVTAFKRLWARCFIYPYQAVYEGQTVRIRAFDVSGKSVRTLYKISFLRSVYDVLVWHFCRVFKLAWHGPVENEIHFQDMHAFYEFTFWNGKKKLSRTSEVAPPTDKQQKKILHVTMCGHDVTVFVNQYASSLTTHNNITVNDLFEIALLCGALPRSLAKFEHTIETEFIMCDEIIEKTQFKENEIVCFNDGGSLAQ